MLYHYIITSFLEFKIKPNFMSRNNVSIKIDSKYLNHNKQKYNERLFRGLRFSSEY